MLHVEALIDVNNQKELKNFASQRKLNSITRLNFISKTRYGKIVVSRTKINQVL